MILETIRKLEKVVKAVPRMEGFITSISRALSHDSNSSLPLEQVIPRASFLRSLEYQYSTLMNGILNVLPSNQTSSILHTSGSFE